MESYSATITCLIPNGLLTPKDYKYIIHIKCFLVKVQNHFSQDLLFIGCDIFSQVMVICLHLIKHVPLSFKSLCSKNLHFWGCDILSHPTVIQSTQFLQWWYESVIFKFLKKFFFLAATVAMKLRNFLSASMATIFREINSFMKWRRPRQQGQNTSKKFFFNFY